MKRWMASAAVAATAGALAVAALAAPLASGLPPGQHMGQFNVCDVSGPAKGQTLCYV